MRDHHRQGSKTPHRVEHPEVAGDPVPARGGGSFVLVRRPDLVRRG
jgi:hypothetical protein